MPTHIHFIRSGKTAALTGATFLKEQESRRRKLARKITWDAKSTHREISIYKEIQRMIVADYSHDDIFLYAANELAPSDRKLIASLLKGA